MAQDEYDIRDLADLKLALALLDGIPAKDKGLPVQKYYEACTPDELKLRNFPRQQRTAKIRSGRTALLARAAEVIE